MQKFSPTIVILVLSAASLIAADKEGDPPALRYTVRTELGDRSGLDRDALLKTLKMTPDEAFAWAADSKAAKEERLATVYRDGYVEAAQCNSAGIVTYILRDEAGGRVSRDRTALLKTRKMTAEQIKTWAAAPEAKSEARALEATQAFRTVETITSEKGSVFSFGSKSASDILKQSEEKIRAWVADPKEQKEGRGAILFHDGHVEIIWHGPGGRVLYALRNEKGCRTSADRDAVMKTLKMSDDEVLAWVRDPKAAKEFRAATFYRDGHAEVISRGAAFEPPGLGQ